ncbi:hypothetical protein EIP91_004061 [Steccherinum ochraceum]|uniref:F-box domain-containing protein n=1 Tax=Steccherinum ochraceum TaxID=92696 RepID=A0A4V2MW10_9APHY|nr:hypothetical protein EIP91_004061 [Steccherinum ochraceum]
MLESPTILGEPTLSVLPPELLIPIFTYASTDGGPTARALQLTCRAFHALLVATSINIQFAAVCGVRRLKGFLEAVKGREEGTRRGVESLFLAFEDGVERTGVEESVGYAAESYALMLSILQTIHAPHLRILYLTYSPSTPTPFPILPTLFPSLTNLHINGPLTPSSFTSSVPAPLLKHVHIHRYAEFPRATREALMCVCPGVRSLHVKSTSYGMPVAEDGVVLFLQGYLNWREEEEVLPVDEDGDEDDDDEEEGDDNAEDQEFVLGLPPHIGPDAAHPLPVEAQQAQAQRRRRHPPLPPPYPPTLRNLVISFAPQYMAEPGDLPNYAFHPNVFHYRREVLLVKEMQAERGGGRVGGFGGEEEGGMASAVSLTSAFSTSTRYYSDSSSEDDDSDRSSSPWHDNNDASSQPSHPPTPTSNINTLAHSQTLWVEVESRFCVILPASGATRKFIPSDVGSETVSPINAS